MLDGLVITTLVGRHAAQLKVGQSIRRTFRQRSIELLDSLADIPVIAVDGAEVAVRFGIVRIESEGFFERCHCRGIVLLLQQENPVVVMKVGLCRIQRDGRMVVFSGIPQSAHPPIQRDQIDVCLYGVRIHVQCSFFLGDRLVDSAGAFQIGGPADMRS